jgi:hypothetical protein
MMKLALMRTATGKEDAELTLLQRIHLLVTSLRNCSPNKCYRVQVTDTSHHQLFRGDCANQSFMVELLQRNHYIRTPIRRDLLRPRNMNNGH